MKDKRIYMSNETETKTVVKARTERCRKVVVEGEEAMTCSSETSNV